ncbi:hypothetical protein C8R47DRAFT_107784 [Mycena vitilis]|nr:hypothetical protein C8R47DRAFT_107784 [Mycena vitilis]
MSRYSGSQSGGKKPPTESREYPCTEPDCTWSYHTLAELARHSKTHLSEEKKRGLRYKCPEPNCRYPGALQKTGLKTHFRSKAHIGQELHICSFCVYTSLDASSCSEHMYAKHDVLALPPADAPQTSSASSTPSSIPSFTVFGGQSPSDERNSSTSSFETSPSPSLSFSQLYPPSPPTGYAPAASPAHDPSPQFLPLDAFFNDSPRDGPQWAVPRAFQPGAELIEVLAAPPPPPNVLFPGLALSATGRPGPPLLYPAVDYRHLLASPPPQMPPYSQSHQQMPPHLPQPQMAQDAHQWAHTYAASYDCPATASSYEDAQSQMPPYLPPQQMPHGDQLHALAYAYSQPSSYGSPASCFEPASLAAAFGNMPSRN